MQTEGLSSNWMLGMKELLRIAHSSIFCLFRPNWGRKKQQKRTIVVAGSRDKKGCGGITAEIFSWLTFRGRSVSPTGRHRNLAGLWKSPNHRQTWVQSILLSVIGVLALSQRPCPIDNPLQFHNHLFLLSPSDHIFILNIRPQLANHWKWGFCYFLLKKFILKPF